MAQGLFRKLYYITHVGNVASILQHGILSHERIERDQVEFTAIYNADVVSRRKGRLVPDGPSLWCFANLYFQVRNAMLYQVTRLVPLEDIVVLGVRPDVVNNDGIYITDGNAASAETVIFSGGKGRKQIPKIIKTADKKWWSVEDGSKRMMMAECLVPDHIAPDAIQEIYVANHEATAKVGQAAARYGVPVIPEPYMFFEPESRVPITDRVTLVRGDMFFSRMQTLTVSVNTVGVMGRGLASRAKYQFPDVYVKYQDVCRSRQLKMGKPYLYKRESSVDEVLVDEPATVENGKSTWFLLFATKNHWRQKADFEGIERGLEWLVGHYLEQRITSIAVPALGCGLGGLDWADIGPLVTRHLSKLKVPVEIYLPAEHQVDRHHLTKDYLLGL